MLFVELGGLMWRSECLHQINIFGVAQRLLKQQLVDNGTTAKGDLPLEHWRIKQVAQRPADDEVLFHLTRIRPRGLNAPGLDVGIGYQKSISTSSFITSFHLVFFSCDSIREASRGFTEGSRGTLVLTCNAKGANALAWRA